MADLIATEFVDGTKPKRIEKIKASGLQIIVTGKVDKPYYEILYYDISDKKWHIGYSSYELAYVVEWKNTCFEVVDIEFAEVKYGEWIKPQFVAHRGFYEVKEFKCSVCNKAYEVKQPCNLMNYCPHCGAKMSVNYKSSKNER